VPKTIYAYFNKEDLTNIQNLLFEKGFVFYNENKTIAEEIPAISHDLTQYYIGLNNVHYIYFMPCTYLGGYLQYGTFRIVDDSSAAAEAFLILKKLIRQTFQISKDKMFYIGQSIYRNWIDQKYNFPVLFQYDEFTVDASDFQNLMAEIAHDGFMILPNNVRLRNMDSIDLTTESLVVFKESSKLLRTIIRKSIVHYEYGSECIFVYKNKPKVYAFVLDKRIANNSSSMLPILFEKIKSKVDRP